ncbi:M14 family metallopeptidase [Deinococcus deserti]|uniref:Putative succinylglutamate desuccinylase / aspartoacylase family n=1 Tax=Deinococcus deserti (strain DSM 17065 / CIP 109153 / LMG 22923 / VCD115) TaxID=546414 RepID=C1D3C3_DEIDV|nr:M14 family metallopeptidase [Deinococcus deserti]ACO48002.2 putative succinylglutamate desuccinylase / aspartoacylase family [Deinococcus deserti VCD115]
MNTLIQSTPPGTVARGVLDAPLNTRTRVPYTVVRGAEDGPTLLVTAGVHGAEYASIDAAYQLTQTSPSDLQGTLVVLPMVNPSAFWQRSIYVNPIDGRNLNRLFPGRARGTYAEQLASWLHEEFLSQADALIDLHGGDLVEALKPFSVYVRDHEPSRQLALAFGLPHLIASDSRGMTFEVTRTHGVPAIIAEAGGQGLRRAADVTLLVRGVRQGMRHLGMLSCDLEQSSEVIEHDEFAWLSAPASGLWHPRVAAGDTVSKGQEIGTLRDINGNDLHTFGAPESGTVLFLVTSLAMNEGDPLLGIGVSSVPPVC